MQVPNGTKPGVRVLCLHVTPIANVLWKPFQFSKTVTENFIYIGMVTFVVKRSVFEFDRPSRSTGVIQVRSRGVALIRVLDFKLNRIHLAQVILKVLIINALSMSLHAKLNWCANCFFLVESREYIDSAAYEYRKMSAMRKRQALFQLACRLSAG